MVACEILPDQRRGQVAHAWAGSQPHADVIEQLPCRRMHRALRRVIQNALQLGFSGCQFVSIGAHAFHAERSFANERARHQVRSNPAPG